MNNLTLVLTTYNRLELLKEMIFSLKIQTDLNFDLIIVDNHSNDGSRELLECLDQFNNGLFIKLNWKENLGWAGSASRWNKYIQTVWVSIICDDDWLGENYVHNIKSQISPDFKGIIISGHSRTNMNGKIFKTYDMCDEYIEANTALVEFRQHKIVVAGISGFAVRTSLVNDGFFPRFYPSGLLEDTLICVRAIADGGARICKGSEYFRRELDVDYVYSDRISSWPISHAMYIKDVKKILLSANIEKSVINLYTTNKFHSRLSYFLRSIFINGLLFRDYRNYLYFAFNHSFAEGFFALCFCPLFLLKRKFFYSMIGYLLKKYYSVKMQSVVK